MIVTTCLLITFVRLSTPQSLVGYDCGGPGLNITRMSLLEVGTCELENTDIEAIGKIIRLYQAKKYDSVRVLQCKVQVHRVITHCGMFSHGSPVAGGVLDYLEELTREQCENMHYRKEFLMGVNTVITGLQINGTVSSDVTLAGTLSSSGSCSGTQYATRHTTYDDVVVQASVTITLTSYNTTANRAENIIRLGSGVQCPLNKKTCMDNTGGQTFWDDIVTNDCNILQNYDILYEGPAVKSYFDDKSDKHHPLYTVTSDKSTFSLLITGEKQICGNVILTTETPRLFITELSGVEMYVHRTPLVENLDLITYINAKIVYVERHIRKQIKSLYYDLMLQKCLLERKVLKNLLSFASVRPDEFAYNLMDGPGHTAVVTGELVRLIKCVPVQVTVRRAATCYLELPILRGNTSLFLTPKTHIILRRGTETPCDGAIPLSFYINNNWYEISPKPYRVPKPEMLHPSEINPLRYDETANLFESGIYTSEEMSNLQERILYPMEQPSVLNILARGASGQRVDSQGIAVEHLFSEESFEKMVNSFWVKAWHKFSTFGNAVAGLIGILLGLKLIKGFIDTILQGYALHRVYGWSIKLLGAILTSVTQLLLHMAVEKRVTKEAQLQECIPIINDNSEKSEPPAISGPRAANRSLSDDIV